MSRSIRWDSTLYTLVEQEAWNLGVSVNALVNNVVGEWINEQHGSLHQDALDRLSGEESP